jgi:NTP pyrophosphatase (non-canonical NTP hydrolase)
MTRGPEIYDEREGYVPAVWSPLAMVREFHEAFGVAIDAEDTGRLRQLRNRLLHEEYSELRAEINRHPNASGKGELTAVAKELADLVYVAYGTAVSLGIDLDEALRRVHASNMSKRNPDGSVSFRDDGKVLKPQTYQAPDMTGVTQLPEEKP